MASFLIVCGVILWVIIFGIVFTVVCEYYVQNKIKKAFKTVRKINLDKFFKESIVVKVKEDISSFKGTMIKAGETVRIIPHDQFKREYKVLTKDYRFIEGVTPDKLEIHEESK